MITNFSDEPFVYDKNSIFLAGPTARQSLFKDSWRKQACDYLEYELHYDGTVYIPEFADSKAPVDLVPQASWEREGLMNSGAIIFYLCRKLPEMLGLTTNVEFGRYFTKRPENCLLCSPAGAEKNKYLIWQYKEESNRPIYATLEEVLEAAVKLAHDYDAGLFGNSNA